MCITIQQWRNGRQWDWICININLVYLLPSHWKLVGNPPAKQWPRAVAIATQLRPMSQYKVGSIFEIQWTTGLLPDQICINLANASLVAAKPSPSQKLLSEALHNLVLGLYILLLSMATNPMSLTVPEGNKVVHSRGNPVSCCPRAHGHLVILQSWPQTGRCTHCFSNSHGSISNGGLTHQPSQFFVTLLLVCHLLLDNQHLWGLCIGLPAAI
jgi:hypothetical protein